MRIKFLIFIPVLEIRGSKQAYTINQLGHTVEIFTEDSGQSKPFTEMLKNIPINKLHSSKIKHQFPFDIRRNRQIAKIIKENLTANDKLFIIARDVIYCNIIGKILKKENINTNVTLIADIGDNYDLAYDAYNNIIIRTVFKFFFRRIFAKTMELSNFLFTVCPVNKKRILESYNVKAENIYVLRNLPLISCIRKSAEKVSKIDKTLVYIGYVDNLARDLKTVLEALTIRKEWTFHLYSEEKRQVIEELKDIANQLKVADRVIVHNLLPYQELYEEVRQYQVGIIPHKRNLLTDYTVPNKLYDYLLSGNIVVASDNPSIIEEREQFANIYIYEGENFRSLASLLKNLNTESINLIEDDSLDWKNEFEEIILSILER